MRKNIYSTTSSQQYFEIIYLTPCLISRLPSAPQVITAFQCLNKIPKIAADYLRTYGTSENENF